MRTDVYRACFYAMWAIVFMLALFLQPVQP